MKYLQLIFLLLISFFWHAVKANSSIVLSADTIKNDSYYFVSNRNNTDGKFTMYKARTNHSGISSCLIKGNFQIEGYPNMRRAEIAVHNLSNDKLVGIYNTNPSTGNYLVILVPNVKYEFVINAYGYAPIKKIVEIPIYASTKVLDVVSTQQISLKMDGKNVQLSLKTWIVEEVEPTIFLLTIYNENRGGEKVVELYQAAAEDVIIEKGRRTLKESDFGSIDELIKSHAEAENKKPELAKKAFFKKDYKTAIEIYSQLLKLDEDDPVYNYRKGVALFYTDQNKLKSLSYLKKAALSNDTPYKVYYLLGRSYHLGANFSQAQEAYQLYQKKATSKEIESNHIIRLIENCKYGKELMGEQLDMQIVNKSAIVFDRLLKSYPAILTSGKLMKKTKFFISPIDGKKKEELLMFRTENNEMIQTSYGLDNKNGKDLFVNRLMGSDKWGVPQSVGENINTSFDEEYAYVTLDGKTMYLSSKGHNSIGGYDIFVSTRATVLDVWGKPKNIGYPINSPYDDILFIPNLTGDMAYFSSNRRSPTGDFNLYEIKMPKPALGLTIVKGHFVTTDSIPDFSASIAVYNTNNQEIVGVYNTNPNTGNFLMALMPGIKYEMVVTCVGFKEHTAFMTVPAQTEIFALRQNIRLKKDGVFEILKMDNFFTQEEAKDAPIYALTKDDFKKTETLQNKEFIPSKFTENNKPDALQTQILASAKQLFINKQYIKSSIQYAKVAPLIELNAEHSFNYGKALFKVSRDYETTLQYLELSALDRQVPYEVFYMLGKTNHYAYRFERAIKSYEKYKLYATEKQLKNKVIHKEIDLARSGKKLINNPKPIEVISKKSFKKENLHTIYNSIDLSSKFLLAPEGMISVNDKKEDYQPIMYLNSKKTMIYYASYGEDGLSKDIYSMRKLPNNTWTAPINLGIMINTEGDEDFPYVTEDGKTLYFCSTKHGSMGGYDIFKATWNNNKAAWNYPVNLGAPINSPFDDFFFVK